MRAVDDGRLGLDEFVSSWLREWRGTDRESVTIRDLLAHSSGLTAYLPFFRDYAGRFEFERAICTMPLEYAPRIAIDLQRSRLHAARVHPRGCAASRSGVSWCSRSHRPIATPRDAVPATVLVLHCRAAALQSAAQLAVTNRADGSGSVARSPAGGRSARRKHLGARRRRRSRRAFRYGRRRRRVCASRPPDTRR